MKGGVKLREAKATALRRVLLARSCAMGGEDVVREVKGVDEAGIRVEDRDVYYQVGRRVEESATRALKFWVAGLQASLRERALLREGDVYY